MKVVVVVNWVDVATGVQAAIVWREEKGVGVVRVVVRDCGWSGGGSERG